MLDVLLSPEILGLIFIALVIVGVIVVFLRRRRKQAQGEAAAPPTDIGGPIDYTSIPYEEPTSLIDRFRNAPPAMRILIVLVPLVVIAGLIALALAVSSPTQPTAVQPTVPPVGQISITRAEVAGNGKIVVVGTTNLPNDAQISATLKENEQDFAWFAPDTGLTRPSEGKITLTLDRADGAPAPNRDREYTIILKSDAFGQSVTSEPTKLNVLQPYDADFYQTVAVQPTPAKPTPTPTPSKPETTPTIAATSEPTQSTEPQATVIGGGKIRKEPSAQAAEVGQVTRGETVALLERTQDGAWYRIQTAAATGWLSSVLLEVAPEVAAKVPTPAPASGLTTTVFNGGNVRADATIRGKVLDQINAGETVTLLNRTADNQWFQITNIRGISGWVNRTLLNLSVELARQVPVFGAASTPVTAGTPVTPPVNGTPIAGLTATVFNGGNVRAEANVRGKVLDQINAKETVQLLAKTADGKWYQITNIRKVTGWVSVTLLTIDPDVGRKVPIAK
jgi:flagellar FliL protein